MKKHAAVLLSFLLLTLTLCLSSCESAAEKDLRVILQARCTADGNQSYTSELISGWDGSSGENIFWSVLEERSQATLTLFASGRFEYATTLSLTHFIDSDMDAVNDSEIGETFGSVKDVLLQGTYSFSNNPKALLLSFGETDLGIEEFTPSLDSLPIYGQSEYQLTEEILLYGSVMYSIDILDEKGIGKAGGEITPEKPAPAESTVPDTPAQSPEESDKEPSKISAFFSKAWKWIKAHPWLSLFIALLLLGGIGGGVATVGTDVNPLRKLSYEELKQLLDLFEEHRETDAKHDEKVDEYNSEVFQAEQAERRGDKEACKQHFVWAAAAQERIEEYLKDLNYIESKIAELSGISDIDKVAYYLLHLD